MIERFFVLSFVAIGLSKWGSAKGGLKELAGVFRVCDVSCWLD